MKSVKIAWVLFVLAIGGYLFATGFTDLDTLQHQGKTGLKDLVTGIDANFAMMEAGTVDVTPKSVTTVAFTGSANGTFSLGTNVTVTFGAGSTLSAASLRAGTALPAVSGANVTNMSLTLFAGKTLSFITLTNVVYEGGGATGTFNVVKWQ
jgi:hypothetical protein